MTEPIISNCPECDAELTLNDLIHGEIVVCSDCGVDLEVTCLEPLSLELAPMEQEDWGEQLDGQMNSQAGLKNFV